MFNTDIDLFNKLLKSLPYGFGLNNFFLYITLIN